MQDQRKTKAQLIKELKEARSRIAELEAASQKPEQEELAGQKQQLDDVLKGTNAGTWNWNVVTGEVTLNDRWAEIMGRTLDELEPIDIQTWIDYVHPEDLPFAQDALNRHFTGASDYYDVVFRQPHKDGGWVWVVARGKVVEWTDDGKPLRMRGTHLDITERMIVAEALGESEETFRSIVESSPMGIHLYELQDEGRLVFVGANPAADKLLGVDNAQFIGKTIEEAFPPLVETEVPDRYRRAALHGESWSTEQIIYTHGAITGAFKVAAFRMSPGKTAVLFNDITERKKAEEALHRLRNYLTNIIDSMPSVLIGVDSEGVVTQWNTEAQRATGVSVAEAIGQPLTLAFPRLAREMARVREAMRTREVRFDPRQTRKEKGETRYEDVTVYPLVADGIEGAVIRVDDVTERVRLEEMMVQSEKMLSVGGLAAGMAHEINNPLAGIIQSADVLSHRLVKGNAAANQRAAEEAGTTMAAVQAFMEARSVPEMLDNIQASGARAARIIKNMLSFARKTDSAFSDHNLPELLDQCLDLAGSGYDLKKKYDFRRIEIVREYEMDLPVVPCEGTKIQQVVLNVLHNGAEAMHEKVEKDGGVKPRFILRLAHERENGLARIEIEDNGPGMEEAVRKRVFEPFFTTKPIDHGTGLGLSVSYFIITENHGGEMDVRSTPGEGTTFTITLPVNS